MEGEIISMSQKELRRVKVLDRLLQKQIKQSRAAELIGVSVRQIKRLKRAYQQEGIKAIISKRRGKPSNNLLDNELKSRTIKLLKTHYADFGPTLACEKLLQRHEIKLSKESVRQLMIQAGLWKGKKRKQVKVHQQRERREALGELVQTDGSPHAWFEKRGEPCCLLVIIDDATGKLLNLHFVPVETTQGYFRLFKSYLKTYGRPLACYHDKHGIFQVNTKEPMGGNGITQFERAMNDLGIESISANSPQAKGRVERVNKTLQDRLVKELRLRDISDIDTANRFLPQFIEEFNQKFAVVARSEVDAHQRTLPDERTLELIFSEQYHRKISKNLEISFQNKIYQIKSKTQSYAMRHARVTVCVDMNNHITLLYKGKSLPYSIHEKHKKVSQVATAKEINHLVNSLKRDSRTRGHKPSDNHPWRKYPSQISQTSHVNSPVQT